MKEESFHEHIEFTSTPIPSQIKPNTPKKKIIILVLLVSATVCGAWRNDWSYSEAAAWVLLAGVFLLYGWMLTRRPKNEPVKVSVSHKEDDGFSEAIYPVGAFITGFITFLVSWVYCTAMYGFLFGFGLGWLPSIILAYIVGFLWPLVVPILLLFLLLLALGYR